MVNNSSLPFAIQYCALSRGQWIDENRDLAPHSTDNAKVNFSFKRAFCVLCFLNA